ncbi:sugar transferase [Eggerthella lenta]
MPESTSRLMFAVFAVIATAPFSTWTSFRIHGRESTSEFGGLRFFVKEDKDEVQPRVSFPEECPPFPRTPVSGLPAAATPSWLPSFQCVEQRSPRGSSPSRCVGQINSHCGRVTANKLIDSAHPEAIDELPQFLNCLMGQLSCVGPRPPLPSEVTQYDERAMRRLSVKPGLTGYWQVRGRSDTGFEEMVDMDLAYIEERSFLVDLKVVAKTVAAMFNGKGAC